LSTKAMVSQLVLNLCNLKLYSFSVACVDGDVVFVCKRECSYHEHSSEKMVEIGTGRVEVPRRVRVHCPNDGEIHGQSVKPHFGESSAIGCEWRNQQICYLQHVLALFPSEKQDGLLWVKPSSSLKNYVHEFSVD